MLCLTFVICNIKCLSENLWHFTSNTNDTKMNRLKLMIGWWWSIRRERLQQFLEIEFRQNGTIFWGHLVTLHLLICLRVTCLWLSLHLCLSDSSTSSLSLTACLWLSLTLSVLTVTWSRRFAESRRDLLPVAPLSLSCSPSAFHCACPYDRPYQGALVESHRGFFPIGSLFLSLTLSLFSFSSPGRPVTRS